MNVLPAGATNITRNLHLVVQTRRWPDRTPLLWLDVVRIEQANISERNSHLNNIPRTYVEESGVLAWLGLRMSRLPHRLAALITSGLMDEAVEYPIKSGGVGIPQ